jgi:hypothetical protein
MGQEAWWLVAASALACFWLCLVVVVVVVHVAVVELVRAGVVAAEREVTVEAVGKKHTN